MIWGSRMNRVYTLLLALSAVCAGTLPSSAWQAGREQVAAPSKMALPISDIHRRSRRSGRFANWCAYNCISVRGYRYSSLGAYNYRFMAYDQDIPAHYRWDRDASIQDNVLAPIHAQTGGRLLSAFEQVY